MSALRQRRSVAVEEPVEREFGGADIREGLKAGQSSQVGEQVGHAAAVIAIYLLLVRAVEFVERDEPICMNFAKNQAYLLGKGESTSDDACGHSWSINNMLWQ